VGRSIEPARTGRNPHFSGTKKSREEGLTTLPSLGIIQNHRNAGESDGGYKRVAASEERTRVRILPKANPKASAPLRLCASAPLRLCANFSTFFIFIIFNSVVVLIVTGCGGRDARGLPQERSLLAAEEVDQSSLPLVPSQAKLNLGQVAPGSQKSSTFWLTNRSDAPVEVIEIASSCDCLKVELPKRLLAPGQKIEGRVDLDLRKEPQFLGNLGISVKGRGKKGETVFALEVDVSVDND
jgi:hypothetical protein